MRSDSQPLDAEIVDDDSRPAPIVVSGPTTVNAQQALADAREIERFKSELLGPDDWFYPKRGTAPIPKWDALPKLLGPFGIQTSLISTDEYGSPGVRRVVQTDKHGNEEIIYMCAIRGTNKFGMSVEHSSTYARSEWTKPGPPPTDNTLRAMCQARCNKKVVLRLIGGIDFEADDPGEEIAPAPTEPAPPAFRELLSMAIERGVAFDMPSFLVWAKTQIRSLEDIGPGQRTRFTATESLRLLSLLTVKSRR